MKNKELIEKLSLLPPDFEVFGMDNFNDSYEFTGVQVHDGDIYICGYNARFKPRRK